MILKKNEKKFYISQLRIHKKLQKRVKKISLSQLRIHNNRLLFMTNEEIWNIGLEERTDELSKLQSEYDRIDVE